MKKEDWKKIIYKNGKIDEEQVMKELEDYGFLLEEVPKVYCEITGGLLSKLNYKSEVVLAEFNDHNLDKETTQEDVIMLIRENAELVDLIEALKDYFEIKS